jgi:hypothetical protein
VPADLVNLYFNCLRLDHITVMCPNVDRCLCCRGEGHQALSCKWPRSPDATGPP